MVIVITLILMTVEGMKIINRETRVSVLLRDESTRAIPLMLIVIYKIMMIITSVVALVERQKAPN